MKIVIFHRHIPKLGGIESAVYNLAKLLSLKGHKVIITYNSIESVDSLYKYSQVADILRLDLSDIECDVCILASNHKKPSQIIADKYLQWVHSDYEKYKLKLEDNGNVTYVAVSQYCAEVFERLYHKKCKVIYNLVDPDFGKDKRPVLRLVTNSRISPEKGFDRMHKMALMMQDAGIRYSWTVYGDNTSFPNEFIQVKQLFVDAPSVNFVGYKQDIENGLALADYLVQLSDWEGCPYSVLEALHVGVPCIVTKWGGVEEIVQNGINGYVVPMDMDFDINIIIKKPEQSGYIHRASVDQWLDLMK